MDEEITRILQAMSAQAFTAMEQDLARAGTVPELLAITRAALEHTGKCVDEVRLSAAVDTACAAGCSFCCWLRIDATAPEILLIARYLRYHWTSKATATLLAAARQRRDAEAAMDLPALHRYQRPCLLLQDGLCQIYPVRPMACRRYFSGSIDSCHRLWSDPEAEAAVQIPLLTAAGRSAGTAVSRAFAAAGYDTAYYELTAALTEALEDPGCEERWAQKGAAFSAAARTRTAL